MPPPYYRARYYHTDLQRFISEDPLGYEAGDVNLYAYVLDNPLAFVDPLGLYTVQELAAIINNETAGLRGNLTDARIAKGKELEESFWPSSPQCCLVERRYKL